MAAVVLNGSSANGSLYNIDSTAANTSYTINGGDGADTFNIAPVIIQGVGANLDAIAGPVAVNGGGGSDSLNVTDQNNTANDTYSISTGAIERTGSTTISYAKVPTVMLDGGTGNETFEIKSFAPTLQFTITGGAGINTLDYAAFSGNVTVDLRLGLATGLTGGISNIQNVTGSKGNDILVGDANPNILIGGTGRNLIIGGTGADTLIGGPSGDILIGDYTDYDTNIAALDAIMAGWDSSDSYSTRYAFITGGGGLNGSYVLNATTVHNDFANDTMTGGAGRDWFFASLGDTITDAVTGGPNKEEITTI
jgi:Ca2+-binding RTX toxin-like protein